MAIRCEVLKIFLQQFELIIGDLKQADLEIRKQWCKYQLDMDVC